MPNNVRLQIYTKGLSNVLKTIQINLWTQLYPVTYFVQ